MEISNGLQFKVTTRFFILQEHCCTAKDFAKKSHYALLVAIRELFRDELDLSLIQGFEDAMNLRQTADYGLTFSEEGAIDVIKTAEKFLFKTKEKLKINR